MKSWKKCTLVQFLLSTPILSHLFWKLQNKLLKPVLLLTPCIFITYLYAFTHFWKFWNACINLLLPWEIETNRAFFVSFVDTFTLTHLYGTINTVTGRITVVEKLTFFEGYSRMVLAKEWRYELRCRDMLNIFYTNIIINCINYARTWIRKL